MNFEAAIGEWTEAARAQGVDCDLRTILEGHGDFPRWRAAFEALPDLTPEHIDLGATIRVGPSAQALARDALESALHAYHPWRKGPFDLFGVTIDTEWRSDFKWQRVAPHVGNLNGARVLDVGAGNGYYGWRMAAMGARAVLGCDPTLIYVMQHLAIASLLPAGSIAQTNVVVPLRLEALPAELRGFDAVFSMGVLYHRPDPHAHLAALRARLRDGGEVVVETLVVAGSVPLYPTGRYARMRNVHAIPDVGSLETWLREAGFRDVRVVDVTPTTTDEQRRTPWMTFDSLADALQSEDPTRTVEGHPAPIRAIALARR